MATPEEIEAGAQGLWYNAGYRNESWNPDDSEVADVYRSDARAVLEAAEAVRPAVDRAAVEAAIDRFDRAKDESYGIGGGYGPSPEKRAARKALLALIAPETGAK